MSTLDIVPWPSRKDRIDQASPLLLWQQVSRDLRDLIDEGTLKPGERLPTEHELADIYGVGRVTIRRAVAELRSDSLVVVVRGRGTFVARRH